LPLLRAVCEARRGVVRPGPSARRSSARTRATGMHEVVVFPLVRGADRAPRPVSPSISLRVRRSRLAGRAAGIARPAVNRLWNLAPERRVPPRWPAPAAYAV